MAWARLARRNVERWIPVEKVHRNEHEASALNWHDGPILHARHVRDSQVVPKDHVGVHDWPIFTNPDGKPEFVSILVGEVPSRSHLTLIVGGHPNIALREARA